MVRMKKKNKIMRLGIWDCKNGWSSFEIDYNLWDGLKKVDKFVLLIANVFHDTAEMLFFLSTCIKTVNAMFEIDGLNKIENRLATF